MNKQQTPAPVPVPPYEYLAGEQVTVNQAALERWFAERFPVASVATFPAPTVCLSGTEYSQGLNTWVVRVQHGGGWQSIPQGFLTPYPEPTAPEFKNGDPVMLLDNVTAADLGLVPPSKELRLPAGLTGRVVAVTESNERRVQNVDPNGDPLLFIEFTSGEIFAILSKFVVPL